MLLEDLLHDHTLRVKRTEVVRPAAGVATASIAKILKTSSREPDTAKKILELSVGP